MAKTLYVGNLPWTLSEDDLARAFTEHLPIQSARVIYDRETGRSRGFGFVEVQDQDVEKAVSLMNGAILGGRTLTVNEAQPRQAARQR